VGNGKRGEFQEMGRDSSKGSLLTWVGGIRSHHQVEVVRFQRTINLNVCATCQLRNRAGENWFSLRTLYMIILTGGDRLLLPQMHFFFSPASARAIKSPSGWFDDMGKKENYNTFVAQVHQKKGCMEG
jgi:hypothetical protein